MLLMSTSKFYCNKLIHCLTFEHVQASLESIRDSLAEELVKLTEQVTMQHFISFHFSSYDFRHKF
jgi:hypothetical protein